MTENETILWKKIEAFEIDDKHANFSFSQRLARDNGWSVGYAKKVIEEYRKFIFLCCVTTTGVTPSDIVDQAWHLHLTYTKSYWVSLCQETLGKDIHHNPTKGGNREAIKFDDFYTQTLNQYKEFFGYNAPENIWQGNDIRFSDINFQRINLNNFWLIKKPAKILKKITLLFFFLFMSITLIQASDRWLAFTVFAIVFGIIAIAIIRNWDDITKNPRNNGADGSSGCSGSGHHGDGHSGCNSGCSGCSSSGCSGCGGGD